jgi:mono/diheme cytochrome c family protein
MNPKPILTLAVAAVAVGAFALGARPAVAPAEAAAASPAASAQVARGEYLSKIMGCNDCHTPFHMTPRGPEPDMPRMLSGHPQDLGITAAPKPAGGPWIGSIAATNTAWAGPWGVSFTANLTPDPETGLGKWTVDTFIAAIRNGKHEGQGRPILPPMPWPMYRNATDEDLRALFAYLQSIPAIRNRVPQPLEPAETN